MGLPRVIRSNSAVSEVMGTLLLLLIVVGLFSVVSISVFNLLPFNPTPSADIICQVNGNNIILTHRGGDALSLDTKIGFSTSNGSTHYIIVKDYLNTTEKADGKWSIGEKIVYSNRNLSENQIRVMVIDPGSNSCLLSTVVPMVNSITVRTLDATDITLYSANLPMYYDSQTKSGSVRFSYRPSDGGWINTSWISKSGFGSYNIGVSNLSSMKLYYFKAQFLYNSTIIEGDEKSFITGCPVINTSVNMISPYVISFNPLTITAAGNSDLDNVTLYYRWSDDNSSWTGGSNDTYDSVDSNTCNIDGSADKGVETNFPNSQGIIRDTNVMTIQEAGTGGADHKTGVQGNTCDVDSSPDKGTETNFANAKGTSRDGNNMVITEVTSGLPAVDEHLYVNSFNQEKNEWTNVGTTPYLSAVDGTKYITTSSNGKVSRWFTFTNTASTGNNLMAALSIYVTACDGNDYVTWGIDTTGDNTAEYTGIISPVGSNRWYSTGVIPGLNTGTLVNSSRVSFTYVKSGQANIMTIDCAQLNATRSSTINNQIDFEYNWSKANFSDATEELCFYVTSHTGSETLNINYRNGASWTSLGTITNTGWTNVTATGLTSKTYTIQLIGATESGDTSQDAWNIDCIFLHSYNASNYQIDFEYQWTAAVYNQANKQMCLYVASHTGTENLLVNYWTGSAWSLLGTIYTTGWSNFTATGLSSSTYTIQLKGATESGDSTQDSWNVDVIMLRTWNNTGGAHGQNWIIWSNANNPDTSLPWSWNFDFPKGSGYYEFYTIGKDIGHCGGDIESAPANADARCRKT